MNLDAYTDAIAHARQHFEEGLIRAGFTETDNGWTGVTGNPENPTEVLISLPERFPFKPPRVAPVAENAVPWSWHRELDGALCLIAEDDHEGLWWIEAPAFLEHVSEWLAQAAAGWPDDRPDLDLDRYFHRSEEDARIYLYEDLGSLDEGLIRFRPARNNTMRASKGVIPRKLVKAGNDRSAYVADAGEIDVPPRTWADINARIRPENKLDARIRRHEVSVVLLKYRRGNHDGVIALEVWPTVGGDIAVWRLTSAADTTAARTARAGVQKAELGNSSVAIIGLGALGSFVADMLARAGIGRMTLVDGDLVLPGNIVRHLVGPDTIGLPKIEAVKRHIVARNELTHEDIQLSSQPLTSAAEAALIISNHDLVVNATADFTTTALLHVVAESLGTRILSASLHDDGTAYRVDILPPANGASPMPPLATSPDTGVQAPELFDAGCGSPISPTPPHAVIEAAAAAVRHSIGLLTERILHPAGESRDLTAVPERHHS
ncbi:ThiF family adenylyltransferase [Arthrobacter sp. Soil762]|uniref:ThiF family adenylyltransferase n=1 Tax=Arthrobacter sp. Soil762 TaxID=1736401 RepID=UPI0006F469DA|nr:ThiF family adenylyltransferase [Arthrobacter sp. Soil762]KRE76014.1 thiamine biosynthesis protein ThiF [Arthrobacter sp. Soil762]